MGEYPLLCEGSTLLVVAEVYQKASQDLRRAEILLTASGVEGAGFHLQQTAENYFKSCLLGKGWPLKRTHDLEVLLNEAITKVNEKRLTCELWFMQYAPGPRRRASWSLVYSRSA
jgi:HEPN domain-containing protein